MNHEDNTREGLFADPEEIVTFAQAYFATEFPNGERRDCPSVEQLRAVACSSVLPDLPLREHLFNCSECFRSYRSARMCRRPLAATRDLWWPELSVTLSSLTLRRTSLIVGSVSLFLIGFAAVALIWNMRKDTTTVALNNSRQEIAGSPTPSSSPMMTSPGTTNETRPVSLNGDAFTTQKTQLTRRQKAATRISPKSSTLPLIEVNLKEDGLLRDGDAKGSKQRDINLLRERQRLRLRMPEGSSSGRYAVTVVDAFGKPLITTTANSNGRTLSVELDLRSLETKKYRLCLECRGEAPDCYVVSVNEQAHRAVN